MIYARQPSTISELYTESLEDLNKLISIREEHGDTYYNQLFDSIRETYLYRDVSLGGASEEQERALHRAIIQLSHPYIEDFVLGMDQIQDSLQSRILTDIDILLTLYTTSL